MKVAHIVLSVSAVLAFAQSAPKKATPPSAKADTWQKSKECAQQAEKLMAEWHRPSEERPGKSGISPFSENHYSPKYNRCFIKYTHEIKVKDQPGTVFEHILYDAFEKTTLVLNCITTLLY
jgi:hypothetical protein